MDLQAGSNIHLPLYFKQKKNPYEAAIEIIAGNENESIYKSPKYDEVLYR